MMATTSMISIRVKAYLGFVLMGCGEFAFSSRAARQTQFPTDVGALKLGCNLSDLVNEPYVSSCHHYGGRLRFTYERAC